MMHQARAAAGVCRNFENETSYRYCPVYQFGYTVVLFIMSCLRFASRFANLGCARLLLAFSWRLD